VSTVLPVTTRGAVEAGAVVDVLGAVPLEVPVDVPVDFFDVLDDGDGTVVAVLPSVGPVVVTGPEAMTGTLPAPAPAIDV
jgi:hypothetical protein